MIAIALHVYSNRLVLHTHAYEVSQTKLKTYNLFINDCFKDFLFWFFIPGNHIIYLFEKDLAFSKRSSDVYLVTDSFISNLNCDVAGPLRHIYFLELKEATLYVSSDGQQTYS